MRRLFRNGSLTSVLALLLGVSYLFAQGVVLAHEVDPATLASDHVCEVCISASILGGANVAVPAGLPIARADTSIEPAAATVFVSATVRRARARAPPAFA